MEMKSNGDKQLKTEYKPEQLASLLQAAASQPLPVMMTSSISGPQMTPSLAQGLPQSAMLPATFPGLNGATLYRPPFQTVAPFPPAAAILPQQAAAQNGECPVGWL
jgi:hypothetical protein